MYSGDTKLGRRRFARFPTKINTVFKDGDGLNFAFITDIGHGGVFVECARPLSINSPIRIMANRDADGVVFEGKVVHISRRTSRRGMGVEFVNLDKSRKCIRDDILLSLMYQHYDDVRW